MEGTSSEGLTLLLSVFFCGVAAALLHFSFIGLAQNTKEFLAEFLRCNAVRDRCRKYSLLKVGVLHLLALQPQTAIERLIHVLGLHLLASLEKCHRGEVYEHPQNTMKKFPTQS